MNDQFEYQTNVLFLLIGTNPLPNYVAARLLTKTEAERHPVIYLLHTPGIKGTGEVAKRLKKRLKVDIPAATILPREIDEVDGGKIENKVADIIGSLPSDHGRVGLNYSGGTKPMAVHVHYALRKAFPESCFSYVDARSLEMVIKRGDATTQKLPIGRTLELSLEDVIALHGYKLTSPIREQPKHPNLFRPLAQVTSTKQGYHEWAGSWNKKLQSKGWLQHEPLTTLPSIDQYPRLRPLVSAFEQLGGTPQAVARYLRPEDNEPKLNSCRNWFKGTWLEEYCLDALRDAAKRLDLNSFSIDLKVEPISTASGKAPKDFQLDVAAMLGYQLYAISCIASEHANGETKKHLFEAYVRARQLGGDEARVALVSCVDNTTALQDEVERSWDAAGRIRVFGRCHLLDLNRYLLDWFETANKEG